ALVELAAPSSVELAGLSLARPDPPPEPGAYFLDWQVKSVVVDVTPPVATPGWIELLRQFLARPDRQLDDYERTLLDEGTRALLDASPDAATAAELLGHGRAVVRNRAALELLRRSRSE